MALFKDIDVYVSCMFTNAQTDSICNILSIVMFHDVHSSTTTGLRNTEDRKQKAR